MKLEKKRIRNKNRWDLELKKDGESFGFLRIVVTEFTKGRVQIFVSNRAGELSTSLNKEKFDKPISVFAEINTI